MYLGPERSQGVNSRNRIVVHQGGRSVRLRERREETDQVPHEHPMATERNNGKREVRGGQMHREAHGIGKNKTPETNDRRRKQPTRESRSKGARKARANEGDGGKRDRTNAPAGDNRSSARNEAEVTEQRPRKGSAPRGLAGANKGKRGEHKHTRDSPRPQPRTRETGTATGTIQDETTRPP